MNQERWAEIKGYEGMYLINDSLISHYKKRLETKGKIYG